MNNYQLTINNYPFYKDSGVEWLGDVPEHWGIKKLKDIISITSGDNIKLIDTLDVNFVGEKFPIFGGNGIMGYTDKYNCSGDSLVIGRVGAKCGNVRYINKKIWVSDNALIAKSKMNNRYLEFFINTLNLNRLASANAQPLITSSLVKNEFIAIPTANEINAIADYLDNKTAQIDRKIDLLSQKAKLYTNLKQSLINETVTRGLDKSVVMKDSGIEWIGEVPKHWELGRVKDVFMESKSKAGSISSSYKVLSLTMKGVIVRNLDNNKGKMPASFDGYQIVQKNNIVFCLFDMDVTPRIVGYVEQEGIITSAYTVVKNKICINMKYFYYYFLDQNRNKSLLSVSKTLRSTLNFDTFSLIRLPIPPLSEQKAIADYLDTKTAQIDQIIQTINAQIEKLKELRKTLINDVVTGKIKIIDN